MKHRYSAAELRVNRWFAGNGETHFAEFARVACGMLMLGNRSNAAHKPKSSTMQMNVIRFMLVSSVVK
jgi:hypothetical protein